MQRIVGPLVEAQVDVLALAVTGEDALEAFLASEASGDIGGSTLRRYLSDRLFSGDPGAVIEWPLSDAFHASVLLFVGCGKSPDTQRVREMFGTSARKARNFGAGRLGIIGDDLDEDILGAAVEGAILGGWAFRRHLGTLRSDKVAPSAEISVVGLDEPAAKATTAVEWGALMAEATIRARDLVSEPANVINPATFAEEAGRIATDHDLELSVLDVTELERIGAGALATVGMGSDVAPCLLHLIYRPDGEPEPEPVGLVGKCITFDTGGYSIKTGEGMLTMKSDMAGGAAVLAVMAALRQGDCRREVHGIICAAENMISGKAFRPGDVVTSMNGVTIEIVSTDAEGRLVLADGLVYAARQGVRELIDIATLTGAANVALGGATALFASDDGLADRLLAAAADAGERTWRMPIYDDFGHRLKGEIADLKNSAGRAGGAIVAARFLQYFTESVPWAHLDIAGSARSTQTHGYTGKGATGAGVRTMLRYLLS
jgi:leucyl aminopeptidase